MTQDSKEILLKVLSEQLPYGVLILDTAAKKYGKLYQINNSDSVRYDCQETGDVEYQTIFNVKPYLRPMSSMTEEERLYFHRNSTKVQILVDEEKIITKPFYSYTIHLFDWLNSHHFDYRGLIEKGLALEALEGMYKNE